MNNADALRVRERFALLQDRDVVYLDNAASTQKPARVLKAINEFYTKSCANVHRGIYALGGESTRLYEKARAAVAGFINALPSEIVFTKGATEAFNLLAHCLPGIIGGRDEIVLTQMEHHSNLVPWQMLAEKNGWNLKYIRLKDDFTLDYADAAEKITGKTAVVSFVHVSNALGTVNDVEKISKLAKDKGALVVLDAAQSIARVKLDVKQLGVDFLAFSGHKMYGPTGIGVLWGRNELLAKMAPYQTGGEMISKVTFEGAAFKDFPARVEAGTPNMAGVIGLGEAVGFLEDVGVENIGLWGR